MQLVTPAEELLDLVGAGDIAALDLLAERLGPAPVAVAHHPDVLRDLVRRESVQEPTFVEVVGERGERLPPRLLSTPTVVRPPSRLPGLLSGCSLVPWAHDPARRANYCGRPRARSSPSSAAGCTSVAFPLSLGRRHRPGGPGSDDDDQGRGRGLRRHLDHAVRLVGAVSPRPLGSALARSAAPARPLHDLLADRRHLHAVRDHAARRQERQDPARPGLGWRAARHRVPRSSGSARRAGSICRSTSRSAGRRSSGSATSPRPPAPQCSR